MMTKVPWSLLVAFLWISVGPVYSHAQSEPCGCWQIVEVYEQYCSTTKPPCESSYPVVYCGSGCLWGQCGATGWGTCCGKSWRPYSVYGGDACGPNLGCGTGCGLARAHAASHVGRSSDREAIGSLNARPNESMQSEGYLAYESAILVPDRCQHTYGVLYLHGAPQRATTITHSEPTSGGGL
jgi:hypothetical protein